MKIQTYEIEEQLDGPTPEVEAQAAALIEELDLEGQRRLFTKDSGGARRFPYPEMTAQELAVYEALFPAHTKIHEYTAGIIPVRVLQVAAHCRSFCELEVWHKAMKDPDPLLIGWTRADPYTRRRFLLARWGEALKDFSELVNEARSVIKAEINARMRDQIRRAQMTLEGIDDNVDRVLAGESIM